MTQKLGVRAELVGPLLGLLSFGCAMEALEQPNDDFGNVRSQGQGLIIGTNDFVRVAADGSNIPSKYRNILDAFGRFSGFGGSCTATHVGNGIVLTAGHCTDAGTSRQDNLPCDGARVYFGYRDGMNPSVSYCQRILAHRWKMSDGREWRDYSILRVSPVPAVAVPVDLNARPSVGTPVTMFSHPRSRRLEWSRVGSVARTLGTYQFGYQLDTEPGSSGAVVLSDDSLRVVGIHSGSYTTQDWAYNRAVNLADTPLAEFLDPGSSSNGDQVRFVSRQSGKCLDVSAAGSADGTNIHLWSCNGSDAQNFRIEDLGGGNLRFVNVASKKCVDVAAASQDNGANIHLWSCNGTGAQSFLKTDAGGGYEALINVNSGKSIDVAEWGTSDGSNIQQWDFSWGDNQAWRVEKTGP